MKQCTVYKCPYKTGRPCCADCEAKCLERCLNHPDRCRVWTEKDPNDRRGIRARRIDRKRVVELYDSGLARVEIAEILECSKASVTSILSEEGRGRNGSR